MDMCNVSMISYKQNSFLNNTYSTHYLVVCVYISAVVGLRIAYLAVSILVICELAQAVCFCFSRHSFPLFYVPQSPTNFLAHRISLYYPADSSWVTCL